MRELAFVLSIRSRIRPNPWLASLERRLADIGDGIYQRSSGFCEANQAIAAPSKSPSDAAQQRNAANRSYLLSVN